MTNPPAALICVSMNGSTAGRLVRKALRTGFALLFAAMSLLHFPVMAFAAAPQGALHAAHANHADAGHAHHRHHGKTDAPAPSAACDGYACFLAVEPAPLTGRPLHAILLGLVKASPAEFRHAAGLPPDLPPPRLRS